MTFEIKLHGWKIVYYLDDCLYKIVSPLGMIVRYTPTSRQAIDFVESITPRRKPR